LIIQGVIETYAIDPAFNNFPETIFN